MWELFGENISHTAPLQIYTVCISTEMIKLLKLWILFQCNTRLFKMALHNSKVKVNVL